MPPADYLARHGRPIRYAYVPQPAPLAEYQTVFAREPGSAEMPSAGRPFTTGLITELVTRGIGVVPITLHTGVSSQDVGEPPQPERFAVPPATARAVESTRSAGRRVVAVGTTVTRALESALDPDGRVVARRGWTDLVLGPQRPARVVTGLVTGWHAPGASHLHLLEAVAGAGLVERAYAEALRTGTSGTSSATAACCCPDRARSRGPRRTASCSRPLRGHRVAAVDAVDARHAGHAATGLGDDRATAAMSHSARAGSTAMSTAPSATRMWDQKSPYARVRHTRRSKASRAGARSPQPSSPT